MLAWELAMSQLLSAQTTSLSHLTCLRSSLYSLSAWVLRTSKERKGRPDESEERTNRPEGGGGGLVHGWPIAAEPVCN